MRIGVLTYDHPHRKTYDLLCRLKAVGFKNVCVIAFPWEKRKPFNPIIKHRPDNINLGPSLLAHRFDYDYTELRPFFTPPECDVYLIGGAGILDKPYITNGITVNCHPGYLPNVKGLDALKWAIYEGQPIGVTTHIITENVDAGPILERNIVPIYPTDTFHAVAIRQYEMEIEMLTNSVGLLGFATKQSALDIRHYIPHRRMPKEKEFHLFNKFNKLLEKI